MDSNLRSEAESLGISVDSRWSDITLQSKIDEKKADNDAAGTAGIIGGTNDGPSKEAAQGAPVSDDGDRLKVEATPKAIHSASLPIIDDKTRLIVKAQELNITVDPTWDEDRLRGEIQMAREGRADLQVKGAVPPAGYGDPNYDPATKKDKDGIEVVLKSDYWQTDEKRIAAGTPVWMSKAEAKRLIDAGVAQRNDPL